MLISIDCHAPACLLCRVDVAFGIFEGSMHGVRVSPVYEASLGSRYRHDVMPCNIRRQPTECITDRIPAAMCFEVGHHSEQFLSGLSARIEIGSEFFSYECL
ncbi:MAG: hypothetical protein ACLSFO_05725 [Anaerovoracaceae bacterium]